MSLIFFNLKYSFGSEYLWCERPRLPDTQNSLLMANYSSQYIQGVFYVLDNLQRTLHVLSHIALWVNSYRWDKWGLERWYDLTKARRLITARTGTGFWWTALSLLRIFIHNASSWYHYYRVRDHGPGAKYSSVLCMLPGGYYVLTKVR